MISDLATASRTMGYRRLSGLQLGVKVLSLLKGAIEDNQRIVEVYFLREAL